MLYIDWQPSIEVFRIGIFSLKWYSLLWMFGLMIAYMIVKHLYKQQGIPEEKFYPQFFYCFIGVLAGARLGHCIFYQPDYFLTSGKRIIEMFLPIHIQDNGSWSYIGYRGLASHGGTIGLFAALAFYWRKENLKPMMVLDNVAIAAPATACCIRLGNLMNSEIIGKTTDMPWAFIFHTQEALVNGELVPRHPTQLYEALAYLLIFAIGISLYQYWRKSQHMRTTSPIAVGSGFYFGYCIMTIFTFRFFVEFLKKEQVDFEQGMLLDMGQLLSIPFVFVGLWCMIKKSRFAHKSDQRSSE